MTPDGFEIALLKKLQEPLPLCQRPFAQLAHDLNFGEREILSAIRKLRADGLIRRLRAHINYRALGRIASLVTAHVPDDKFPAVTRAVNSLPGVSHNYCRHHHYNLWYTLQAKSLIAIDVTLRGLRDDFDIEFHSLPALRLFKLDVRFDPAGPAQWIADDAPAAKVIDLPDTPAAPVELTPDESAALSFIQNELVLTESPFILSDRSGPRDMLPHIESLSRKGVLGKIAAVLDYTKLGYTANALLCIETPAAAIASIGPELARVSLISHCYQRRTFAGWPFNLYAMCHAADLESVESFAASFCIKHNLPNYQILPTVAELKKEPVKIAD